MKFSRYVDSVALLQQELPWITGSNGTLVKLYNYGDALSVQVIKFPLKVIKFSLC